MYNNQGSQGISEHIGLKLTAKGIIVSYIITIPIFIVLAFILTYTDFPEKYIPAAVMITTVISVLIAGSTATRNIKNKGWLNGGAVGLVYMLVLYLLSGLVYRNFTIDKNIIVMVVVGIVTGAIGGIIGINLKRNSKSRRRG